MLAFLPSRAEQCGCLEGPRWVIITRCWTLIAAPLVPVKLLLRVWECVLPPRSGPAEITHVHRCIRSSCSELPEELQDDFHSSHTISHPHQQCARLPVSPCHARSVNVPFRGCREAHHWLQVEPCAVKGQRPPDPGTLTIFLIFSASSCPVL